MLPVWIRAEFSVTITVTLSVTLSITLSHSCGHSVGPNLHVPPPPDVCMRAHSQCICMPAFDRAVQYMLSCMVGSACMRTHVSMLYCMQ